ncbi:MAG TPA: GMC family oxidoreductase N-terminal domain-containing protein [Steroidobacteraceae bacterium]|nr:GMC family oxidoreductase N-terminal domain-containing protein [Steroidobacteraceae bacterium]
MSAVQFDTVIVGGGSAGCVLANRLSADPARRVCLIEAGPEDRSPLIHIPAGILGTIPRRGVNWAYQTEPQAGLGGRRGYVPRGRVIGGSSAINAMIYMRGHRTDYDDWAALGNPGWSYEDVLPVFRRSEDQARGEDAFHGVGGELAVSDLASPVAASRAFVEAAVAAGLPRNGDFNAAKQEGAGLYQVTQRRGRRCSAAVAFLHPVRGRANLTVLTGRRATRIRLEGGRAIGAEVTGPGGSARIDAREVIVSAGTFGSPHLLLLSGIGPREELTRHGIPLQHELPGVGANLADHVDLALVYRSSDRSLMGITLGTALRAVPGYFEWRRRGTGLLTTNYAEAGAFLRTAPQLARPDIQLHFVIGIVDDHARRLHYGYGVTCHVALLRPSSRGRVGLRSADPLAAPRIDPNYLADEADLATLLEGVKRAREIMAGAALAPHRGAEMFAEAGDSDDALVARIRRRADTIYHPLGTCRMGNDAGAVVDASLRVRGIEGLSVVDASVMPTIIGGNTNAPTVMIAEKAAMERTG